MPFIFVTDEIDERRTIRYSDGIHGVVENGEHGVDLFFETSLHAGDAFFGVLEFGALGVGVFVEFFDDVFGEYQSVVMKLLEVAEFFVVFHAVLVDAFSVEPENVGYRDFSAEEVVADAFVVDCRHGEFEEGFFVELFDVLAHCLYEVLHLKERAVL